MKPHSGRKGKINENQMAWFKEQYDRALDTRSKEISLFWQRSLFFWGFIVTVYTLTFATLRAGIDPALPPPLGLFVMWIGYVLYPKL